jgi:hypothetical protein
VIDKLLLNWLDVKDSKHWALVIESECLVLKIRESIPEWLAPLWTRVRENPDNPWLIKLLRQVLVFGYKAKFEPTYEQKNEAYLAFLNTDRRVGDFNASFEKEVAEKSPFWRTARAIVARVTGSCDFRSLLPSHGPGAVFPPFDPITRSQFSTIYDAIEVYYPYYEYFKGLPGFHPNVLNGNSTSDEASLRCLDKITCNLCFVPKDSRGPRLISVHPREAIWIQQGQRRILERAIQRHCEPFISLKDQSVNGRLALSSSLDQKFCTLDLSEASDRLGTAVVRYLLGDYHYDVLSCARATHLRGPDGCVIELQKWAPMGNALCFPIESLCFWALVRAGIATRFGTAASECYVFGDDILCRVEHAVAANESLERAGLMVNKSKSFVYGFFRESCGVDAYRGINVTPQRIKSHGILTYTELASLCSLAKNLRTAGYEETACRIYSRVRKRLGSLSLTNNPDAQGIAEYVNRDWAYMAANEKSLKWDNSTQRYVSSILLPHSVTERGTNDWYHLQDSLLLLERRGQTNDDPSDGIIGSEYPVPHRVRYKRGWTEVLMSGR